MTTPMTDSSQGRRDRKQVQDRPSLQELRAAQRLPMSEGYSGLLYRQFSLPLTWLLVQAPVTANQLSILWAILGLVAAGLMATGAYGWMLLGALLLQLVAVLDRVDGEVARYKNAQSLVGVFWDFAGHIIIKSFLFVGISLGIYRNRPDLYVIFLGVSASAFLIIGLNVRFYQRYVLLKHHLPIPAKPAARNIVHKLLQKLENLWWTLGLFGVVLAGALLNQLYYVLAFYGITTPVWALTVLLRAARELQRTEYGSTREAPTRTA